MSPLPARLLKKDMLYIDHERERVFKVDDVEYVLPGTRVWARLSDQMTRNSSTQEFGWDQHVFVTEGLSIELDGPHGKAGSLTVELASMGDDDDRLTFRWTVRDHAGDEVGSAADIRSAVGERYNPRKAMESLLSFLGAAAEARGADSENWTLFPEEVRQWAAEHQTELEVASLEFDESRGLV